MASTVAGFGSDRVLAAGGAWPDAATYARLAAAYPLVPVLLQQAADLETPISLYLKLVGSGQGYLLESVEGGERVARYSFIGARPFSELACGPDDNAFAQLREALDALRAPALEQLPGGDGLPAFMGGLVGYLGYDAVRALERLPDPPTTDRDLPAAWFLAAGILAILDHATSRLYLVALRPHTSGESPAQAYQASRQLLAEAEEALRGPVPEPPRPAPAAPGHSSEMAGGAMPPVHHTGETMTRDAYMAAVERAKEYIHAGDIYQVVLSQRTQAPAPADSFDLYRTLRRVNPSPYMFYLNFGSLQLVGASPEMLVRVEDGQITYRPIAGTRARGGTPVEDRRREEELRADPKELAEHAMLLDLGRNDVGRISRFGSVAVKDPLHVERYSHVMHLVSEVTGELAPGRDGLDALAACFPAGTLTGAPKIRAMQIIDELEPVSRGPYGGAVGYLGFAGSLDTCIAIRTAVVQNGVAYLQAGAGIVADSDPGREFQECQDKNAALRRAVEEATAHVAGDR